MRTLPSRRIEEARDGAQDRRLAAARGAEEGEELAALDVERRIVDGGEMSKPDGYVIKLYARAHAPLMPLYSCCLVQLFTGLSTEPARRSSRTNRCLKMNQPRR